jgi:hypothetical protein
VNRPLIVILPLVIFFSLLSCGGNGKAPDPIEPSKDLNQLVSRAVDSWLFLRVSDANWKQFQKKDWSEITTRLQLVASMKTFGWDIDKLISQLQDTELYQQEKPTETVFIELIVASVEDFTYEE